MARRGLALMLLASIGLTGCAQPQDNAAEPASTPQPTEQSTPPRVVEVDPSSRESVEPMEDLTGTEQDPQGAAPTWDAAAQQAAEERALTFMRAFARPQLADAQWYAGIAGLMTPQGAELFAYVDPANVPPTSAEDAEALPNESPSLAEVHVATDAGTYLVTLTRTSATGPWLVEYTEPVG